MRHGMHIRNAYVVFLKRRKRYNCGVDGSVCDRVVVRNTYRKDSNVALRGAVAGLSSCALAPPAAAAAFPGKSSPRLHWLTETRRYTIHL